MQSIVTDAAYKIVRGTSLMIITDHLLRRTHKQRQVLFRFSFQLASGSGHACIDTMHLIPGAIPIANLLSMYCQSI